MDEAEAILVTLMTPDAPDLDAPVAELVNRPAWHREALCRGVGTEVFVGAYQRPTRRVRCAALVPCGSIASSTRWGTH